MCLPQDPLFKASNKIDPVANGLGIADNISRAQVRTGPQTNFLYRRSLVAAGSQDPAKTPQVPGYGLTISRGTQ
jgi:hypothetical protein